MYKSPNEIKAKKLKEKETYNLENKTVNQQEVNKKLKEENLNQKSEKVKSDKEGKRVNKMIENLETYKN